MCVCVWCVFLLGERGRWVGWSVGRLVGGDPGHAHQDVWMVRAFLCVVLFLILFWSVCMCVCVGGLVRLFGLITTATTTHFSPHTPLFFFHLPNPPHTHTHTHKAHDTAIKCMQWSHNGNFMLTGARNGVVKYWARLNAVSAFDLRCV
jgi:WD40 repeat protein